MTPTDIPDLSQYFPYNEPVPPPPVETITKMLPRVRRRTAELFGGEFTDRPEWGVAAATHTVAWGPTSEAEAEAWAATDADVRAATGSGPDFWDMLGEAADRRDTEAMRVDMVSALESVHTRKRFESSLLRRHLSAWLDRHGITARETQRKATLLSMVEAELYRQFKKWSDHMDDLAAKGFDEELYTF